MIRTLWVLLLSAGASVATGCRKDGVPSATSGAAGGGGAPGAASSSPLALLPPAANNCSDGFCRIEPGTFTMGAPRTEFGVARTDDVQVEVTLTRPFLIGMTEVTRAEWEAVGLEQPVYVSPGDGPSRCTEPGCPVDTVTFFDAVAFANRFSEVRGLPPCYTLSGCTGAIGDHFQCTSARVSTGTTYDCAGYRLPSEAEWEYAARAGTTTAFYSGDIERRVGDWTLCYPEPNLEAIGWYCGNAGEGPHVVGQKTPNAWGLYDMLGNAYEYCNDLMDGAGYGEGPLTDPIGSFVTGGELMPAPTPEHGPYHRVIRGGGYFGLPLNCKASRRLPEMGPVPGVGFRLARTLGGDER